MCTISNAAATTAVTIVAAVVAGVVWWEWRSVASQFLSETTCDSRDEKMLDSSNEVLCDQIFRQAEKRGSAHFEKSDCSSVMMKGRVGGHAKIPWRISTPPVGAMVWKPLLPDHRGIREVAFYEAAFFYGSSRYLRERKMPQPPASRYARSIVSWAFVIKYQLDDLFLWSCSKLMKPTDEAWNRLDNEWHVLRLLRQCYLPQYFGVAELHQQPYLLLEDLTKCNCNNKNNNKERMSHPNVMDIKIGTQTFEPDATQAKKDKMLEKYPQQSEFGFRIVGMRVYDTTTADYQYWDKSFGRSLTTESAIGDAFQTFFLSTLVSDPTQLNNRKKIIQRVVAALEGLQKIMELNRSLGFYSSSILIVYETDNVAVKMVDFGHVRRQAHGDLGYLQGLVKLRSVLSQLL